MRIDVEKFLIVGPKTQQEAFFARVQQLGIVEFFGKVNPTLQNTPEIETLQEALHILRRRVPVKQAKGMDVGTAIAIARAIVEKNEQLEKAEEEKRVLEREISRVEVFGDFSMEELQELHEKTQFRFQFFFRKKGKEEMAPTEDLIYVGSRHGLDYFVSVNKETKSFPGYIEMQIEEPLSKLERMLAEVGSRIDTLSTEISTLAHQKNLVSRGLLDAINRFHLQLSSERSEEYLNAQLFSVYGWVPSNKVHQLQKLCDELDIYCAPVTLESGERVPTYLENQGVGRLGEDLVNIYDTPSAQDRDPSPWVFWAFGLFFSMIIGDAGYGAILLAITLFLKYKFGAKASKLGKRVLTLSLSLAIGCVIWGVITASYFGINIAPESSLKKLSFIHWMVERKAEYVMKFHPSVYDELLHHEPKVALATTPEAFTTAIVKKEPHKTSYTIYEEFADNVMLELVIFIGTMHIMLSFLRHIRQNLAGIGWIIFLVGGYLYFPSLLKATSLIHYIFGVPAVMGAEVGLYLLFGGAALATLLALIQKKWAGLTEPMLMIQVFGDVMSYLRIYALALAGVMMAATFNNIAAKAPLIVGILIILAGHTVNFVLALMGGLIHGLRLNFIEWYHYSFEGGGKLFQPLSILKNE